MTRPFFHRWLTFLLAIALLALSAGEGWHHHDGSEKQDCAYCQFTGTSADSSHVAPPAPVGPTAFLTTGWSYQAPIIPQTMFLFPSGRSPPTAS